MLYVAYGSNLDNKQMEYRCPDAVEVGTGIIEDYKLLFRGSKTGCYATIEAYKGENIDVEVWDVTETDEMALDRYEGFPKFYFKQNIKVKMKNGEVLNAMVYIMDRKRKLGLPSEQYYDVIKRSYDRLGFNKQHLEKSIEYVKRELGQNE